MGHRLPGRRTLDGDERREAHRLRHRGQGAVRRRPTSTAGIPATQLGEPGKPPYTRGVYPTMYRGKLWTMRQYAGFGTATSTNERFKFLLQAGQTGLSCAFDLPTQMGYDSDHPRAEGEVGKVGVAIDSIADMRMLLADLPLDTVIDEHDDQLDRRDPAAAVRAGRRGAGRARHRDQRHDPERHPEGVHRPRHVRLSAASRACGSSPTSSSTARQNVPKWNTISISGYHIREAGSDGGAGDRVHHRQRHRLRRGGARRRPGRRRVRPAAELLLERAQQLLRRGRQVPRRRGASGTG